MPRRKANRLEESKLTKAFERWWPDLSDTLVAAEASARQVAPGATARPPRKTQDLLEEILELSRGMARQVSDIADRQEESSSWSRAFPSGPLDQYSALLKSVASGTVEAPLAPGITTSLKDAIAARERLKKLLESRMKAEGANVGEKEEKKKPTSE